MGWTKEEFMKAAAVTPGNLQVYIERTAGQNATPVENIYVQGSFHHATGALDDGRAFLIGFALAEKQAAEDFAAQCRKHPAIRVVEGPDPT